MFKILLICAAICLVAAYDSEVVNRKDDVRPDGFDTGLEQTDGSKRSESGNEHGDIKGEFEWVSPEGEHVKVTYVADEHGYQPDSKWLPVPPPIPEAIVKSLEWIAKNPSKDQY